MISSRVALAVPLAAIGLGLALVLVGCSGSSTTSGNFSPSTTASAPGLVKLLKKTNSGSRVVIEAVLFGPEPDIDLFGFSFGIRIGDPNLVKFVSQSSYNQTALVPDAGQTISIHVDGVSDPSLVRVEVEKTGGGVGNGITAAAALVIELPFDVQGSGGTALTLVGLAGNPPRAFDSLRASIDAVTFDAASGGVTGVTSGGGY